MAELPNGRVTFFLSDIADSTRLWEADPEGMRRALVRHDALVEEAVERHGGRLVRPRGEGDSRFAVFPEASGAVAAACELQRALAEEPWPTPQPLRIRIAIHTGEAELRDGDYYGTDVNRCARLRALAHPGQTLLTRAARDTLGEALPPAASLKSLGIHRLRDVSRPEHVFQLVHPGAETFPPLASAENPNNLPAPLTRCIGRDADSQSVRERLAESRLVTLLGPGGCGKTRLALCVAAELLPEFPDGVWWVALEALADPALVPHALAGAVGLREERHREMLQTVIAYFRSRTALLVVDNCEHLLGGSDAKLPACLGELLSACPGLQILATSREALDLPGEVRWRVAPLAVPEPGLSLEETARAPAVELFLERARAALPGFHLTPANAAAIARICRRLDGIPLALELAAALVRTLPVEQIAAGLDHCFALLTEGNRALPRQQTLRAAVDWGYALLDAPERELFARLSVFAGGFTLEAAQAVCGSALRNGEHGAGSGELLAVLTRLVEKSFVATQEDEDGVYRYRLLEILRQYGRERLAASGAEAAQLRAHAEYFLNLAQKAEVELLGRAQAEWLERLETERENLRAAMSWQLECDPAGGLRLAGALWRFWYNRGSPGEGRHWLDAFLARSRPPEGGPCPARARALNGAGNLATIQGEYATARAYLSEALDIYRELGDETGAGHVLNSLGIAAFHQGDYAAARALYEESLRRKQAAGDRTGVAHLLNNLAIVAYYQEEFATARRLYEESLALRRELGAPLWIANSLNNLGYLLNRCGEHDSARAAYEECLAIYQQTGNRRGIATCLHGLATAARDRGELAAARDLYLQSLALREQLGDRLGMVECLEGLATLIVLAGRAPSERDAPGSDPAGCSALALRLLDAAAAAREELGTPIHPSERAAHDRWRAAAQQLAGEPAASEPAPAEERAPAPGDPPGKPAASHLTLEEALAAAKGWSLPVAVPAGPQGPGAPP